MAGHCVVSWSGGKDSTLAVHRARQQGYEVTGLLTMFSPETGTSRSHGLPRELLEQQARAQGLPLHVGYAGWDDYEEEFKRLLGSLVNDRGIDTAVFGDIFLDDHRHWVERVCEEVGCRAIEPLWGENTSALAQEVLELGIDALICTVRSDCLGEEWLGLSFDKRFLRHVEEQGLDPCGEFGEYHTVVVSAPDLASRLVIDDAEVAQSEHHGHWLVHRWHSEPVGDPP